MIHKCTNELCILLYTGVTATAKTSVVRFTGFHPTQPCLEGGHCYADKLLLSYCLHIAYGFIHCSIDCYSIELYINRTIDRQITSIDWLTGSHLTNAHLVGRASRAVHRPGRIAVAAALEGPVAVDVMADTDEVAVPSLSTVQRYGINSLCNR